MIERAKSWSTRCLKRQALSLVLLLLVFGSMVYGVADAIQGIERALLWPLVWIGLALGWMLACSRLPGWLAAAVSLAAGAVLTFLRVGQLSGALATLLGEVVNLVRQVIQGNIPPPLVPVQSAWAELASGVGTLVARLYTWLLNLTQGQPPLDPVPIAFLWSLALWGTVIWASWAVRRQALPLLGVAPAVALLASTLAYVGGPASYLLPVLAAALVLEALVGHDSRSDHWEQVGLRLSPRVRPDTAWMALGTSLVLMIVAALTPSISVYRIVDFIQSLSEEPAEEEVARSLGLEPQPEPAHVELTILDARRSGGLPTRHLIGSGPELSEQVVMVISIEPTHRDAVQPIEVGETADQPVSHYYWRGLTYDRYAERGWSTEYAGRVNYAAGEPAIAASKARGRLLRQNVRLVEDGEGLLFVAGSLVTTDRDFRIAWRVLPGSEQPGDVFGAMIEATSYRADSLLPVFGEVDLRTAGHDYPAWVVERYLALPDGVPDRVLALARDLTATERTPYDRALAIERYLRRFPYTLDLPAPPADRDIADYFLFDLQRGYCDYYATTMVVLARAAGLPARLVTGYTSGTYDETEGQYIITKAEAHSWAEVYFPGFGWIEFEPTAGRPAITRPVDALPEVPAELQAPPEPITARRARLNWAMGLGIGGGLLALALGCLAIWLFVDAWRLKRLPPGAAVIDLYRRLYRYARWLGAGSREGDTPHEFATTLTSRLKELAQGKCGGRRLLSARDEIRWLTELCARTLYSRHPPQASEQSEAVQMWGRLRRRLWLARLLTWTPRS